MAVQQTFEFLVPPPAMKATATKASAAKIQVPQLRRPEEKNTPTRSASEEHDPQKSSLALRVSIGKPVGFSCLLQAKPKAVKLALAPAKQEPNLPKQEQVLQQLRGRVHGITTASNYRRQKETFSTGSEAIDQLLQGSGQQGSGLRVDAINEWVAGGDACGAAALSLAIAAARLKTKATAERQTVTAARLNTGSLVVVADNNHFYPPAAAAVGIDPSKIIWVRPTTTADAVWSIDQALRCTGVSAVWAFVGTWLDDRDARRFQLAAETGRTTGILVRPGSVRGRPTFADARFHVAISKDDGSKETHSRQTNAIDSSLPTWTLTLDRCQGANAGIGRQVQVTMDHQGQLQSGQLQNISASRMPSHEPAAVHLASQLAHPKTTSSTNPAGIDSRRRA